MKLSPMLVVAVSLFSSQESSAQVVVPRTGQVAEINKSVFGLGLYGGAATGVGLSFRHHLPMHLSYQITGGVIKADERLEYAVGGEIQYDLIRSTDSRVFAVGGGGYYYSGIDVNEMAAPGRAGIGVGGEIEIYSGFHLIGEALFTYFTDGTILPLPQGGFFYYFQ
jgi:hypothetical protein